MANKLSALALVLDFLDIPVAIDSVSDRLTLQKAVYLVQSYGISLGYSYGWYLKGPYSPTLTRDYYEISSSGVPDINGLDLKDGVKSTLRRVRSLISSKPVNTTLPRWLELLASILYLKKESGYNEAQIRAKIAETKPHLTEFLDQGFAAVQN